MFANPPVLLDVIRSPFGKYYGGLSAVRADDLLAQLLVALQARNPWLNSTPEFRVEQVLVGCANQAGEDARNIARLSCLLAGFPIETVGVTVNQLCGSSAMALQQGVALLNAGMADIVIVGGVENMSRSPLVQLPPPYATEQAPVSSVFGWRFSNPRFQSAIAEGRYFQSMAQTAEGLAQRFGVSRQLQEAVTLGSHQKAIATIESGFKQGIVAIQRPETTDFLQDECPRAGLNEKMLARLPLLHSALSNAKLTAGTCSPYADGAGVALLVSPKVANQLRLEGIQSPLGFEVAGFASVGVDPTEMGLGVGVAIEKLMQQSALTKANIDCWELHEPFAVSHYLACEALSLGWENPAVNAWGGSLALGSPMGAIGIRVLCALAWQLNQAQSPSAMGVGGLSIGMGQGVAFSVRKQLRV
ncbi:MAG: thiolase family protein [Vampirovibrio sp.]|jgi:acetyl-CoA acyltransferase|nr:thiolase family protein [Vampirovibrio sp.]